MSKYLTRDQIVSASGVRTAEVEVPEWGGVVLVRELMTPEVLQITELVFSGNGGGSGIDALRRVDVQGLREAGDDQELVAAMLSAGLSLEAMIGLYPRVVTWCTVDENLEPIFTLADVTHLSNTKSFEPIRRIAERALELTGWGDDSAKNP